LEGSKNKKEVKIDLLSTFAPLIDERCSYLPIVATKKPRLDSRLK
jgi:hypothetical protein